jgi:glycosyltransferase 2 family protein
MKWIAVGLLLTSTVVIAISLLSGVTATDFADIGYLTFAAASGAMAARLLVEVVRFRTVVLGLARDPRPNLRGLALTRVSSEFVSLSTPGTSMGVFMRTAWLGGKGIEGGKALSIGYFEVLIETYVGAGIALLAAIYAASRGALAIGSTVAVVAVVMIVGYTVIFVIPALKGIKVPHGLFSMAAFLVGGPRANDLYLRAVISSLNFSLAARAIMSRENVPVVVKAALLTLVEDFLAGIALWLILNAAGLKIDIISSVLAAYAVVTLAQIPVTIGGAGIAELTMQSYLLSVYNFSSWASVVLWRVATYQVLLALTGIVFYLFVRRATKTAKVGQTKGVADPTAGLTAKEVEREIGKIQGMRSDRPYSFAETFRFALAGMLGFGVTEGALTAGLLLIYGKLTIPHASYASPELLVLDAVSLLIGVTASFLVNERITVHVPTTLKDRYESRMIRYLRFQAVSGLGNIGIVVVQLLLLGLLAVTPILGTIIGAIVTYPIVYYTSIRYVWDEHPHEKSP